MKERLRRLMDEQGVTPLELANRIGCHRSRINGIFNGETKDETSIGVGRMIAIAQALGTTVEWLYDREPPTLSPDESAVVSMMRRMDAEGRKRVVEQAEMLLESGRFGKKDNPSMVG